MKDILETKDNLLPGIPLSRIPYPIQYIIAILILPAQIFFDIIDPLRAFDGHNNIGGPIK